jgi:hypothetical protein
MKHDFQQKTFFKIVKINVDHTQKFGFSGSEADPDWVMNCYFHPNTPFCQ